MSKAAMAGVWVVEEFAYLEEPEGEAPGWGFNEDGTPCERECEREQSTESLASVPAPAIPEAPVDELAAEAEERGFAAGLEQGREEGRAQEQERQRAAQTAASHAAEARLTAERARLIATDRKSTRLNSSH